MRGRIWALLLAVPESAVRVLVCKTESYVDPHGAADGYAAFWASLRRAHSAGEPLPGVINVCEGNVVRELEEVFPLRQSLLPAAVEAAAADGEDLVLLTDATDVFFNYPVSSSNPPPNLKAKHLARIFDSLRMLLDR